MSHDTKNDFAATLQDAVRQNPVSAALIGMGVLWMFTGGAKLTTAAAVLGPAARATATGIGAGLQASTDAASAVGGSAISAGTRIADSVRETVTDAAEIVSDKAASLVDSAKSSASGAVSQARSAVDRQDTFAGVGGALQENLAATFERQPLLLGAIGLAIGAGMAAAVPSTQMEADLAGDAAEEVMSTVQEMASEAADTATAVAERTLNAVKDEAAAQGLTTQAAKDAVADVGGKLKTVAGAARSGRTS
jgi:hypothetical protein